MTTALMDIGFLHFNFVDLLDIMMVAAIIFFVFRWIRGSAAMNIFLAILAIILLRVIVDLLNMKMMSALLGTLLDVGAIALIIIFQPEIRRFLYNMGRRTMESKTGRSILDKFVGKHKETISVDAVNDIVDACFEMGEQRTGALIVIPNKSTLTDIISTGDALDARISKPLIENIFFKNSPLHDGAMIIRADRIIAARCTLPITERTDIPAHYGMRHKAAIGLSERYDASVIVVSEQTGTVSFVKDGEITPMKKNTLKLLLRDDKDGTTGSEDRV